MNESISSDNKDFQHEYKDRLFKAIFGRDTPQSKMTLYEQQSTYKPNLPLRGLMYFAQAYQIYLSKLGKILHRSSIVKIPNPRFIVFYNGSREVPDKVELKLSDAFEKTDNSGNFEWTATRRYLA
ncbi:hypothetical protein [Treponema sp.]|uniref:hypothetical protein n=1 Tax=Treponema sp. TaxID=166 RepID=UPI00298DF887|nr:hypothetical protein [Treponema sp.]MCR5612994.1 hypothetical protein [Treponema sp.]